MSKYNQHLHNAYDSVNSDEYVSVRSNRVSFALQEGPVKECGHNGCDATDIIRFAIGLYQSFNDAVPCRENALTITKLEEALHWQLARNKDREVKGIEGTNKDIKQQLKGDK